MNAAFACPFARWRLLLDARLFGYAGITSHDWPFAADTWRLLWLRGWDAQTVAQVISGYLYEERI